MVINNGYKKSLLFKLAVSLSFIDFTAKRIVQI